MGRQQQTLILIAATPGFAVVQLDVFVVNVGVKQIGAALCALGAGIGLVVPAMTKALMGSVERSRSGVASGTLNTTRQAGSVLGYRPSGVTAVSSRWPDRWLVAVSKGE